MTRPRKDVVDYFPHYCVHKSTMFILEQRYGNDGYAFWFKLLEQLGSTEGHFIDCNDVMQWEFLQAKTRIAGDICEDILGTLCRLKAIDAELWEEKIIWSENFIKQVAEVYRNRRSPVPKKPVAKKEKDVVIPQEEGLRGVVIPKPGDSELYPSSSYLHSRVEESRVEKSREKTSCPKPKKIGSGLVESPSVISIPLICKKEGPHIEFNICQEMVDDWQDSYPEVDVMQELRNIRQWNIANPKRRKTKTGIMRHINIWLADKQNSGVYHGNKGGFKTIVSTGDRKTDISLTNAMNWAAKKMEGIET